MESIQRRKNYIQESLYRRLEVTVYREMKVTEGRRKRTNGRSQERAHANRGLAVINYEIHPSVDLRPIIAAEFENFFPQPPIYGTSQARHSQEVGRQP